jgi:hypothetical protein
MLGLRSQDRQGRAERLKAELRLRHGKYLIMENSVSACATAQGTDLQVDFSEVFHAW